MFNTISTLLRGAGAAAAEDLADRNALLILDQQIRDVAAGVEAGKRALAMAMAREGTEARSLADAEARLADLESRAVAALQGSRDDLAAEAARAILGLEADRDAARSARAALHTEVEALRRAHADAGRRLAALQRGRSTAQAAEAVRRLRASRLRGTTAGGTVAEAEATLARLRARQADDGAAKTALDALDAAAVDATAGAVAAKLGDAGFGARAAPSLHDVMARLKARVAASTAAPAV